MRIVSPPTQPRIFVLDDDVDSRDLLAEVLRASGFLVEAFASAETALPYIIESPALVITDIALSGKLDGFDFARRIRAIDPTIGLIAVTGFSADTVRERGSLFDVILRKPIDVNDLVTIVRLHAEEATTKSMMTLPTLDA